MIVTYHGAVVESVDTPDLKSVGLMPVGVQVSLALLAHSVPIILQNPKQHHA